MGTSIYGNLFYGLLLDDDECANDHPWNSEDSDDPHGEWDDYFMAQLGHEYPACADYEKGRTPEESKAWDDYWERKKMLLAEYGCEVDTHCCWDQAMHYVALKDKNHSACWGDPVEVTDEKMRVPFDAEQKLRRFCEVMGIEYQEPKWWLVSMRS